ncbi:MAG TPA: hypothetical protein VIN05_04390 [Roseovarius sp.]
MASHENTTQEIEEALNASQVLFTANPLFLPPQTKHFFEAQERILDQVETFSKAWFRRRQDATQAMIDASKRIASDGSSDPAVIMKEVTELQSGAMARLTADAKDCTEMFTQCANTLAVNEVKAIEETAEKTKKAGQTAKSPPV